jgi:hypothetical protein
MKGSESHPTIEEIRAAAKADFLRRLRANPGYKRLARIRKYNPKSLSLLEESCWLQHCSAVWHEMRGARARAALKKLDRLVAFIGDAFWHQENVVQSLDDIRRSFARLESKAKRGRPSDPVARAFRRNMQTFIPPASAFQMSRRAVSQTESDEILAEISAVVLGRHILVESFTRMRKRDRADS